MLGNAMDVVASCAVPKFLGFSIVVHETNPFHHGVTGRRV